MVPRAHDVGDVVVNGLEGGVRYLPFFIVLCLSDISDMGHHGDIQILAVFFDPLGLLKKTGALVTDAWPMALCFFMPGVGIALGVG